MDHEALKLVENLHAARGMSSLAAAGAGTSAIRWILSVAGASRTVLDIQVPYASSAVVEYVGSEPEQFVSMEAARSLARAAYFRAVRLRSDDTPVAGVSCTATIATDRTKRGDHRGHVALHEAFGSSVSSLTLVKGHRDRGQEDMVVSTMILNSMAEWMRISDRLDPRLTDGEEIVTDRLRFRDPLEALSAGHVGHVIVGLDGSQSADSRFTGSVIPGSFNPIHAGHHGLARAAERITGGPVAMEVSVTNVDKPPLERDQVRARMEQFRGEVIGVATRAPKFVEKARLLPGCAFVIGVDTMSRLLDPKYYDGSMARMMSSMQEMRHLCCSFLVAGRVDADGFKTLRDIEVPADLAGMFTEVPESVFRQDISSTEIRVAGGWSESA